MPSAAISKLLSMRTGQGYAEFAVSSFGVDGAIGDPDSPRGKWADYLLASRATTIYGGTSEVQLNIIAERLLGLPRDPWAGLLHLDLAEFAFEDLAGRVARQFARGR